MDRGVLEETGRKAGGKRKIEGRGGGSRALQEENNGM